MPATSTADIAVEMKTLTDTLPPPRGVKMEKAFGGYVQALQEFPPEDIREAIRQYLSGKFPEVSLKSFPRAPELAVIVRRVRADKSAAAENAKRAEKMAQERLEFAEAQAIRRRTPEELVRHDELMRNFHRSVAAARLDGIGSRGERERRETALRAAETARIREEYGMTDEKLAAARDARPLPPGMKQLAAPSLPAPETESRREDDPFEGFAG